MKYIECPRRYRRRKSDLTIFLGGGITSCPVWQTIMVDLLKDTDVTILNPRREHFDLAEPGIAFKQIKWEFDHMKIASAILFWFCAETLCPITLFEYGKWIAQNKPLFVGCHPEYQRKNDLLIQTRLVRKRQKIRFKLEDLAQEVRNWAEKSSRTVANSQ
jgi:hypothetical protein